MATECAHGQLARSCEICERDNTIATLRQEIRLMHEDARAKEARIAELERELMAISQDDGKVHCRTGESAARDHSARLRKRGDEWRGLRRRTDRAPRTTRQMRRMVRMGE